jgi:glycine/sarcosine N-methyltransferase
MEFYRILSKAYDEVFPFSEETFTFLKSYANGAVLDVGCATGAYVKRFHDEGITAEGIEYVPELIKYRKNVSVGDMRNLSEDFDGKFSLVYCIGNTLAHCNGTTDAEAILKGFAKALEPKGTCIIQILNYDKILESRPSELPLIKTESTTFRRGYIYTNNAIIFKGTLTVDDATHTSDVQLYPLTLSELNYTAVKSGFTLKEVYGSYSKAPFDVNASFPLIAVLKLA